MRIFFFIILYISNYQICILWFFGRWIASSECSICICALLRLTKYIYRYWSPVLKKWTAHQRCTSNQGRKDGRLHFYLCVYYCTCDVDPVRCTSRRNLEKGSWRVLHDSHRQPQSTSGRRGGTADQCWPRKAACHGRGTARTR